MLRPLLALACLCTFPSLALAGADDVDELRRALRHDGALEALRAQVDEGQVGAATRLAAVSLEAALIARLGDDRPLASGPLVAALTELELSAIEEVALARLALLFELSAEGEAALGRARDLDPELKAFHRPATRGPGARRDACHEGGYFRYRLLVASASPCATTSGSSTWRSNPCGPSHPTARPSASSHAPTSPNRAALRGALEGGRARSFLRRSRLRSCARSSWQSRLRR